jgi:hypothetical protein
MNRLNRLNRLTRMSALGAAVVLAAWFGIGSRGPDGARLPTIAAGSARTAAAAGVAHAHVPSRLAPEPAPPPIDPGTLPQTRVLPKDDDPAFQARVRVLWQAIVDDDAAAAMPAFFPKAAYVQLKNLGNAAGDYDYRLAGYFKLDVHAAHRLLGPDAATARLVRLDVPAANAEWMWPGSEENKVAYYRVYGSRLSYTVNGKTHSLGIFSMLSWRGQWYPVHFGPWPRWERYGDVYAAR